MSQSSASYDKKIPEGRTFLAQFSHLPTVWQLIKLLVAVISPADGFTKRDLALILLPAEVDQSGYPTREAIAKVERYIDRARRLTRGAAIIYSLKYQAPPDGHIEDRYFNFTEQNHVSEKDRNLSSMETAYANSRKRLWITFNKGAKARETELATLESRTVPQFQMAAST